MVFVMVLNSIRNRRSVRAYKTNPVSDEQLLEMIKAAQFAPTAKNNKAVEFVVVKNAETKGKIFDIVEKDFLKQAPVLIIPAIDTKKSGFAVQDLSIASENIFLQAAEFGLGTVWKNLDSETSEKVKAVVGIPKHFLVLNIIPVGYPLEKPAPHTDADFSAKKIHKEKWQK